MAVQIISGAHYVAEGYNIMLKRFLDTDFDKLAFVEWDVSWTQGDLCRLAKIPHDYVGGSTRMKKPDEEYMVGWLPDPHGTGLWADQHGCIEVAWIPQGFSVASREMCQRMWDNCDRTYNLHGEDIRDVFRDGWREFGIDAGGRIERGDVLSDYTVTARFGQDIGWCYDWRSLGGRVHVHPEIELTHTACVGHSYTGRLGDWLRTRIPETD